MKKPLLTVLLLTSLASLCGCGNKIAPMDYSKVESWYTCDYVGKNEVDTFYIYPTVVFEGGAITNIDDNRSGVAANRILEVQAAVYSEDTNIYMPLYRQIALDYFKKDSCINTCELLHNTQAYLDIVNALDYYFAHFNKGKPFILAGHSQGSGHLFNVLTDYMQKHTDYLQRMVACYAIGFGQSKNAISKYSNLKFATGETDTNCIISYNTYGATHQGVSVLHDDDSFVINPINWKTDSTAASFKDNKGSYIYGQHIDGQSDAQVDANRGILLSTANDIYKVQDGEYLFGTDSYHSFDYGFFFENLKENVGKRVEAFLDK